MRLLPLLGLQHQLIGDVSNVASDRNVRKGYCYNRVAKRIHGSTIVVDDNVWGHYVVFGLLCPFNDLRFLRRSDWKWCDRNAAIKGGPYAHGEKKIRGLSASSGRVCDNDRHRFQGHDLCIMPHFLGRAKK